MIKKIVICSDFIMTNDSEQQSNLPWLMDILKRPIETATKLKPELFFSEEESQGFIRSSFFKDSKIDLVDSETQFYFEYKKISKKSKDYLKENLGENTLVIGYELSDQTKKILTDIDVKYIDLWLHPIRFMDDILFAFISNDKTINKSLKNFHLDEANFSLYADRFKISTYKGYKRYNSIKLDDNSVLFIGQTMEDKAVLKDNVMLNITHFKSKMEELSKEYNTIYYSRHPYVKGDESVMDYIQNCNFIKLIKNPAYVLISKKEIKKVVSISSSVAIEAKYFDKEVEILHKPIFEFSKSVKDYTTVFQDFISPHFWSDILKDVVKTKTCDPIVFFDKKDKLRDMLGFYWSYKNIDKLEDMRNTLLAVDKKVQRIDNQVKGINPKNAKSKNTNVRNITKIKKENSVEQWASIKEKVDKASIVSFDVFDTLLVRNLNQPNDLFDYMEPLVAKILNTKLPIPYKQARLEARANVINGTCGEEISLKERYDAISNKYDIDVTLTDEVMNLELDLERKILKRREYCIDILKYAKSKGKKVIIVSDIFFTKDFVSEMLSINNINAGEHYDELFVSSETKLLKHTGNVYPYLLEQLKIKPEDMVHVGDNHHPDIKMAEKHGINSIFVPNTTEEFDKKTGLTKVYNFKDKITSSLIKGVINNKIMDNPFNYSTPSHSGGDISKFGFSMLGPMFYGFANEVLNIAKKDEKEIIYFLARDGEIVKNAYDIITKDMEDAPKSEYLHVSRRALSVPSIKTKKDIDVISKINYSSIEIKTLLKNRFGVDYKLFKLESLNSFGFESFEYKINSKRDSKEFSKFLIENENILVKQAEIERSVMLEYLEEKGLNETINAMIVDIGHNGTLQYYLSELMNNKNISGSYFVTQSGIQEKIIDNGMKAYGFVGHKLVGSDHNHPYNKNLIMFESVFLNTSGSLINLSKDKDGTIVKNFLDTTNEQERIHFITKLDNGILDFVANLTKVKNELNYDIKLGGRESIKPFLALLDFPYQLDVEMFNKVNFENHFSGRDHKWLVSYDYNNKADSVSSSLWKDGINSCSFQEKSTSSNMLGSTIEVFLVLMNKINIISNKKVEKFQKDPYSYFNDSKNKYIRSFSKYI